MHHCCCRGVQGDRAREEVAHDQAGDVRPHLRDRHLQVRAALPSPFGLPSSNRQSALQFYASSSVNDAVGHGNAKCAFALRRLVETAVHTLSTPEGRVHAAKLMKQAAADM